MARTTAGTPLAAGSVVQDLLRIWDRRKPITGMGSRMTVISTRQVEPMDMDRRSS